MSGPAESPKWDYTTFWIPNAACIRDMLLHVGFVNVVHSNDLAGAVFSAQVSVRSPGMAPDQSSAPWS